MSPTAPPIPAGYEALLPYLVVRDAARAIEFYRELFAAEVLMRVNYPGGTAVMHAELKIRNSVLMLGDEAPQFGVVAPPSLGGSPVSIMFYVEDVDAVFAQAVKLGVKPVMPPGDMFWGDRICKFADPFGHLWMIATQKEDLSPEEVARRITATLSRK